jgi:hypothetical protein
MRCDLEQSFGTLTNNVPTTLAGDADFVFNSSLFHNVPDKMSTDQLCIQKGYHAYHSFQRADLLHFRATRRTYRNLGLLILAVLLKHDLDRIFVRLTHPDSDIKLLRVEYEYPDPEFLSAGYISCPYAVRYVPATVETHPWASLLLAPAELPCFWLTNREDDVETDDEWRERNTILGFGSDHGSARLAELLLNIGAPDSPATAYVLEGEGGARGVGLHSAEARLSIEG